MVTQVFLGSHDLDPVILRALYELDDARERIHCVLLNAFGRPKNARGLKGVIGNLLRREDQINEVVVVTTDVQNLQQNMSVMLVYRC